MYKIYIPNKVANAQNIMTNIIFLHSGAESFGTVYNMGHNMNDLATKIASCAKLNS